MPELPEVETTINMLKKSSPRILGAVFLEVWTDSPLLIKKPKNLLQFKKEIKGKKIKRIWRRGKNIIFDLSENKFLLIHQKLTGHLLFGEWRRQDDKWQALVKGSLIDDPMNRFLHLIFYLDNGKQLALSDLRKFAKLEVLSQEELKEELDSLGPEPLDKTFTFEKFKESVLKKKNKAIKQVLMDQGVIAGIGNIYSDEILFEARINPFRKISELKEKELREVYSAIKKILSLGIKLQGASVSDYRLPSGDKGGFDRVIKVYRKEGQRCPRCGAIIKRQKIGGRSAHFCPKCQK